MKKNENLRKKKDLLTTTDTSLSCLKQDINKTTDESNIEYINKVLQQSIDRYKGSIDRQLVDYKEDIENLQNIVLEYLDDFIIIGHTPDARRVVIRYAPSPRDYDALKELSRNFLIQMMTTDKIE